MMVDDWGRSSFKSTPPTCRDGLDVSMPPPPQVAGGWPAATYFGPAATYFGPANTSVFYPFLHDAGIY